MHAKLIVDHHVTTLVRKFSFTLNWIIDWAPIPTIVVVDPQIKNVKLIVKIFFENDTNIIDIKPTIKDGKIKFLISFIFNFPLPIRSEDNNAPNPADAVA